MVILSKFAETLLALMNEHNLNAPAFADIFKVHRTSVTGYLRGERLPDYPLFVAIVEHFNISADVLLGRIDYSTEQTFHPTQPFGNALRKILDETNTSQYRLQKDLGLSSATTYTWLNNKSIPSMEHVLQLADYLDVSVDYLLGRIS